MTQLVIIKEFSAFIDVIVLDQSMQWAVGKSTSVEEPEYTRYVCSLQRDAKFYFFREKSI